MTLLSLKMLQSLKQTLEMSTWGGMVTPGPSPVPPPCLAPSLDPHSPQTQGGALHPGRHSQVLTEPFAVMDGLLAGATVPICSPFGQVLYPQFNLSGSQITLCNQTKGGQEGGRGQGLLGEGPLVGVPMVGALAPSSPAISSSR